ncbi:DUF1360 domain-containing protein [Cytobacillus suaedae]|nr:DUF1360 domain-containing protein [Cytobacillus suaedae]
MELSWIFLLGFGLASFRLTRLLVFDKITAFIRRPFIDEIEEVAEDGTVVTFIEIKGTGIRKWLGELLSCYWCTGIWCSTFLYLLWVIFPYYIQPVIFILAIAGLAGLIETLNTKLLD